MYNTGVYNDLNMFVTKCLIQPYKEKARGVIGAIEIFRSLLVRHTTDSMQAIATTSKGTNKNHDYIYRITRQHPLCSVGIHDRLKIVDIDCSCYNVSSWLLFCS
jgi:hypothetical protein